MGLHQRQARLRLGQEPVGLGHQGEDSMNPRHRNPPGVDIGLRIAQYRRRRKWSQASLALRAGMPRPYVGKVEMGLTIPNPKQVLRFSEALNVGIELLIEPS